jgi:hypothetical protein
VYFMKGFQHHTFSLQLSNGERVQGHVRRILRPSWQSRRCGTTRCSSIGSADSCIRWGYRLCWHAQVRITYCIAVGTVKR